MKKLYAIAAALILCIFAFSYDKDLPSNVREISLITDDKCLQGYPLSCEKINENYYAVHFLEHSDSENMSYIVEKIGIVHPWNISTLSVNQVDDEFVNFKQELSMLSAEDIMSLINESFDENLFEKEPELDKYGLPKSYIITIKKHTTTE